MDVTITGRDGARGVDGTPTTYESGDPPIDGTNGGDGQDASYSAAHVTAPLILTVTAGAGGDGGNGPNVQDYNPAGGGSGGNGGVATAEVDGLSINGASATGLLSAAVIATGGAGGQGGDGGFNGVAWGGSGSGGNGGSGTATLDSATVILGAVGRFALDVEATGGSGGTGGNSEAVYGGHVGYSVGGSAGSAMASLTDLSLTSLKSYASDVSIDVSAGGGTGGSAYAFYLNGMGQNGGSADAEFDHNTIKMGSGSDHLSLSVNAYGGAPGLVFGEMVAEGGNGIAHLDHDVIQMGSGSDTVSLSFASELTANSVAIISNTLIDGGDGFDVLRIDLSGLGAFFGFALTSDTIVGFEKIDVVGAVGAIDGLQGNVTYYVGARQEFDGGGSADHIVSNINQDLIYGGGGDDSIYGQGGAHTIYGGDGNDYVRSLTGDGPIYLDGGAGVDLLTIERTTATQALTLDVSSSAAQALGEGSTISGIEQVRIAGGLAGDHFTGGASDDVLKGMAGDDTLSGGAGNDVLEGGTGRDLLTGGSGADVFRFDAPTAGDDDTVTDFTTGVDKVALSTSGFGIHSTSDFDIVSATSGAFEHKATLIVDTTAHTLSWDADGTGSGAAVLIAHGDFTTSASDYTVF